MGWRWCSWVGMVETHIIISTGLWSVKLLEGVGLRNISKAVGVGLVGVELSDWDRRDGGEGMGRGGVAEGFDEGE